MTYNQVKWSRILLSRIELASTALDAEHYELNRFQHPLFRQCWHTISDAHQLWRVLL